MIDCAALSLELDEDMAGTAPSERGVLVLEIPGPWGRDVLSESRLGTELGAAIEAKAKAAGFRVQGVRRQHRRYETTRPHAWVAGVGRYLEHFVLDELPDLLDLDLDPERPTGMGELEDEPLFLVCTHSTRDACCARRGLPLAREVLRAAPGRTWHSSHLGGHRFAATMACLPLGAWLGRVPPERAQEVVAACRAGEPPRELLRGIAGQSPADQAAQIHGGPVRHVPTGRARPFSCGHSAKEEDPGRWEPA
jgi:hypothetical protein